MRFHPHHSTVPWLQALCGVVSLSQSVVASINRRPKSVHQLFTLISPGAERKKYKGKKTIRESDNRTILSPNVLDGRPATGMFCMFPVGCTYSQQFRKKVAALISTHLPTYKQGIYSPTQNIKGLLNRFFEIYFLKSSCFITEICHAQRILTNQESKAKPTQSEVACFLLIVI